MLMYIKDKVNLTTWFGFPLKEHDLKRACDVEGERVVRVNLTASVRILSIMMFLIITQLTMVVGHEPCGGTVRVFGDWGGGGVPYWTVT